MDPVEKTRWPLWRKIIFRFLFIYLALAIAPWTWLDNTPYINLSFITQYYGKLIVWMTTEGNKLLFHIKPVLVPQNGSGDTSMGWAELCMMLCVAVAGCVIWSAADWKRRNYTRLNYWLCLFTRYYIAMVAFIYGIMKLFALQMVFPSLHQLATPLGDLLPMRLSWLFIGYSHTYQVFSGSMEVLAGMLLLYRRTATLGVLMATGVFINVMMLNLCYDIPVKIFSMQLVFTCLFLLANESERLLCFFILNRPAAVCIVYQFSYSKLWMRITRILLKVVFIISAVYLQFAGDWSYYKSTLAAPAKQPVKNGVYAVTQYRINQQDIPMSLLDTIRWQDVIFEDGTGSVKSGDTTIFRQRYKRGYFTYSADGNTHALDFKKHPDDNIPAMILQYDTPDSSTIRLWGLKGSDSLHVVLKRTNRQFHLAEKQFHWLSEHNR